jgi:hypothetical protein
MKNFNHLNQHRKEVESMLCPYHLNSDILESPSSVPNKSQSLSYAVLGRQEIGKREIE